TVLAAASSSATATATTSSRERRGTSRRCGRSSGSNALFLRDPAHPATVAPAISGKLAQKGADVGGDGVEDGGGFGGGATGGLTAVAVGDDAVEGTEDADDVVHALVREIDRALGVGKLRAEVEDDRHLGLAAVVEVDVVGPGKELAGETLPTGEECDGHP